jgi:hypothetical protein
LKIIKLKKKKRKKWKKEKVLKTLKKEMGKKMRNHPLGWFGSNGQRKKKKV